MIKDITSKITGIVGKTKLVLKIKSPEILLGAGIALVVGGTIVACRATSKAKEIVETRNNEIAMIKDTELAQINEMKEAAETLGLTVLPEDKVKEITKETRSDKLVAHVRCGWELTKLFAPAVIMEAAGIACFLGSHTIMQRRYTGAVAAYEATNAAYRKLKEKYEQGYIEEKNRSESILEDEKSIAEKKADDKIAPFDTHVGPFDFCFDESCDSWKNSGDLNLNHASAMQKVLQTHLDIFGVVDLNECRTCFGMDSPGKTADGQVVGWAKDMGDYTIDLGLPKSAMDTNIWIRPNCHNIILRSSYLNKR